MLRTTFPTARRPFVNPLGIPGVVVAMAVLYLIGLLVFGLWGSHQLVLSPEKEYAMTGGLHGSPSASKTSVARSRTRF
jgi:ethanolamine permease